MVYRLGGLNSRENYVCEESLRLKSIGVPLEIWND